MKKKFSKILGVGLTVAMLATMLVMAAPTLATVSAPSVTVTPSTISASANYTIKFDTYFPLTGAADATADYITVVFPNGTTVPADYTNSIYSSNITVSNDNGATYYASSSVNLTNASQTFVIRVPAGATTTGPAHMAVLFLTGAGIYNPGTSGSYTLSVKTNEETTVVDSTAYTIGTPVTISRYNKAGNFVGSFSGSTALADAIAASVDYDTLKLGAGSYNENPTIPDGLDYLTIVATGTAAETIIGGTSTTGTVTVSGNYTTIDTVTIKGSVTVSATGNNVTIQNSTLTKRSSTSAVTPILSNSGVDLTVKNSTIDLTSGTVADTGVRMLTAGATAKITSVTFKLDSSSALVSDEAIDTGAALTTATNSLVVATSTFTGPYGIGYSDTYGSVGVVIKTSTFDQLEKAIDINGAAAKATIQGNTITNSVLSGTGTAAKGAIEINASGVVTVEGNTIKGNKGFSVKIADADNVTVSGNSLSGNTLGLRNTDSGNTLKAELNWWGASTGPTHATYNASGTGDIVSDYVDAKPFLTADTSAARIATTTAGTSSSLDASTTAGIAVEGVTTTAAAQIVLSKLGANPKTVEPAYTALAGAWFDIYVSAASSTTISAKFYATGITSLTKAYFWSGLEGKWVAASDQGVSGAGDFVWVTIKIAGATAPTVPTTSDLSGTPFVLVDAPAAAAVIATISLTVPAAGAIDKAVTNLPFTWASVSGATSYSLVISANADLSSPVVTATATGTAYTYTGTLKYSTPYYWQVTALKDTTTVGRSDTATFVTVAAPPPVVVVVPPPVVVVPPAPISIVSPEVGATNVSIEPILSWTEYTGAIAYEVMLSTDKTFAILEYSHNVAKETTFYKSEPLSYDTTYYWRARGVTGPAPAKKVAPGGAWANGIFTTMSEPVAPAAVEPTVIIQKEAAPPAQIVEVPVQTIVPQQIPSYLLWVIIVVGAVLIIALIVLIARTRRVT